MESYEVLERYIGKDQLNNILDRDVLKLPLYFGDQPFTIGPLYAGAALTICAAASVAGCEG